MSTFENVSFDDFYSSASEFFKTCQKEETTPEQADNGFKALTLLYFGGDDNWTDIEIDKAVILIKLAGKKVFEKGCGYEFG